MIEYLAVILLIFIFRLTLFKNNVLEGNSKKRYLIASLLPLTLISAFRADSVGSDTASYKLMFERIAKGMDPGAFSERIESGYIYLNKLLSLVSSNPQIIIIVTAVFVSVCIGVFIYRYAKDSFLALLFFIALGFFQFTLSGVRQSIAMGLTLLSYDLIMKRKLAYFILIIIIAASFHKTAFLFLPTYFIANNAITKKNLLWYIPVLILSIVFVEAISLSISSLFKYDYGIESTGNGLVFFLIVLIITLIGFINRQRIIESDQRNTMFLNVNYISMLLWSLRLVTRTAERVSFYFIPATYMVLEEYISSISSRNTKKLAYIMVCLLCVSLFIYRMSNNPSLVPYKFTDFAY